MKKWLLMCLAMLFILLVPVTAAANDSEQDFEPENEVSDDDYSLEMEGLISEWETPEDESEDIIAPGFPESVGHVYFDEEAEKVIIGLVDNNESERDTIRSLVDSPEFLEFESSTYSYNDLIKIMRELYEEDDNAVYNVSFAGDAGTNYVNSVDQTFGESGHEERVHVEVDENEYNVYQEKYEEAYGDKVYVEAVDPEEMQGEDDAYAENNEESALPGGQGNDNNTAGETINNIWLSMIWIAVLALIGLGVYLSKRKRLVAARQTANNGNITESKPLSRGKTVSLIKKSSIKPDHHVDEAILKKIRDQN